MMVMVRASKSLKRSWNLYTSSEEVPHDSLNSEQKTPSSCLKIIFRWDQYINHWLEANIAPSKFCSRTNSVCHPNHLLLLEYKVRTRINWMQTQQQSGLLSGALEQFVPSVELVNRKLPFGLAETGLCFQPSGGSGWWGHIYCLSCVWVCRHVRFWNKSKYIFIFHIQHRLIRLH